MQSIRLFILLVLIVACQRDQNINKGFINEPYQFDVPLGLDALPPELINPSSNLGVSLGKSLFYDPILSLSQDMSCASCHQPAFFFSDSHKVKSLGFNQQVLKRHTPPLFNLQFASSYFWDGAVPELESQVLAPITNPQEMNNTITEVIYRLNRNEHYRYLFGQLFKEDSITTYQLLYVIAQFEKTFLSANAKFDRVMAGKDIFSSAEFRGYQLYKGKAGCTPCHQTGNTFSDFQFHNTGLDLLPVDSGRYRISHQLSDMAKFKTPSLRNLSYTAPYMHDGRFNSLEEVIQHYNFSFQTPFNLDSNIASMQKGRLNNQEVLDLIAFLQTLNDNNFPLRADLKP